MSLFKSIQKKFFPKKKKSRASTRHSGTLAQSPTATDWYSASATEIAQQQQQQVHSLQVTLAQQQQMMNRAQQANLAAQNLRSQVPQPARGYHFYGRPSAMAGLAPDFPNKTVKKPDEKNKKMLEQILKHTLDESQ